MGIQHGMQGECAQLSPIFAVLGLYRPENFLMDYALGATCCQMAVITAFMCTSTRF